MAASIRSGEGEIGFQIAPMVDVVFVLMLFFLACAGGQIKERELHAQFPGPGVPSGTAGIIIIDITAEGQVIANNLSLGSPADKRIPALRDWLKATQGFRGNDPIYIRPHPATRHERIMDVLNACRAAGIEKITFS
ncbi:MAG: biopolymer transporter ExbD [Chthoniobacter sp.]|uniref:ExbD/TolR family protein n=1 Tax=Chthoniobacter sp. TaxID=2510640 RepID=UPI0032A4E2A6